MDTKMNPLLIEYSRRLNSRHMLTARGATKLLAASVHEAGHWMAFAHFKVPVVEARVDRRSDVGSGVVIPTDYCGLVSEEKIPEVDYISTLAGAYALDALNPFVTIEINLATSMHDVQNVKKLLDQVHGENRATRKLFIEKHTPQVRQLIHQNWSIIEALAYELMKHGRLFGGECREAEARYGAGYYAPTSPGKLKSAQKKLAAFHSSPDTLLKSLMDELN